MLQDKITDRIRKLLELSKSDNEHEAAAAAARAATLMAEYAVTEAMLEVSDSEHKSEPIVEGELAEQDQTKTKTAWRVAVGSAVAKSFDCRTFFMFNNLVALGRTSSVNAWRYTCAYLFQVIDRLADGAWASTGQAYGARGWKNAFRLGAATVVAQRLLANVRERAAAQAKVAQQLAGEVSEVSPGQALARASQALAIVARGQAEVNATFEARTKDFKASRPIGVTSSRSGFEAGKAAGHTIPLAAKNAALKD